MLIVLNLINVSKWLSLTQGNHTYYSPNPELISSLQQNPQPEFWKTRYTEFACVIVDNLSGAIQLVRDHFGCEPFFYFKNQHNLYFASSIAELIPRLRSDDITVTVNETELKYMLWVGKSLAYPTGVHEETLYNGINRVKPNHLVTIQNNQIKHSQYWDLALHCNDPLYYKDANEYLEHFTELLHEGLQLQLGNETAIAAECSGGLDSSAIILAAHRLKIPLTLLTHQDQSYDPQAERLRESYFVEQLVKKYDFKHCSIDAENFNLLAVFEVMTEVLAGYQQSIFPIGANIIHQQVANNHNKILLSGFGGDECISSHARLSFYLQELIKNGRYKLAWQEAHRHYTANKLPQPALLSQIKTFLRAQFPMIGEKYREHLYQKKKHDYAQLGINLPQYMPAANTVAEFEVRQLIGCDNNHLSYRIEDSALVARHYGFKYKYPLLYPKLVEFCNRLPLHMKRQNGLARIMIRNYLTQSGMPEFSTKPIAKFDGNIMGSTIDKIQASYKNEFSHQLSSSLPYFDIKQQCLRSEPTVGENLTLYMDLALLSLNQYLL